MAEPKARYVWIEPTTRCNTRCKYCYHWNDNFGADMAPEIYARIRDQVLVDVWKTDLNGYGEPLIAPFFWDMLEDCLSRDIEVVFTTNGILLSREDIISKLSHNGITINISIDGVRKDTFEFSRPFVKWEQMMRVLELLKQQREKVEEKKRFSLRFNFVAMKENIADLPDLVRLAAHYGVSSITVLPLTSEEERNLVMGQGLYDSPELVSPAFLEAIKLSIDFGIKLLVPSSYQELILMGKERRKGPYGWFQYIRRLIFITILSIKHDGPKHTWDKIKRFSLPRKQVAINKCFMPWQCSYFSTDGTVYPCCVMKEKMGNLKTQDWKDIWHGQIYNNLRRTIHGWNPSMVCRYCGFPLGINGGDENLYIKSFSKYTRKDIPLNSPEIVFHQGFYELECDEKGNPHHIWMAQKGKFLLPRLKGAKFLRILIIPLTPLHALNPGFCIINKGAREYFDNTCEDLTFPLNHTTGKKLEVCLEMENEYQVGEDPRLLGLPIRGIQFLY